MNWKWNKCEKWIKLVKLIWHVRTAQKACPDGTLSTRGRRLISRASGRLAMSGARLLKRRASGRWLVPVRTDFLNGMRLDGL